jgi:hypothetical protein
MDGPITPDIINRLNFTNNIIINSSGSGFGVHIKNGFTIRDNSISNVGPNSMDAIFYIHGTQCNSGYECVILDNSMTSSSNLLETSTVYLFNLTMSIDGIRNNDIKGNKYGLSFKELTFINCSRESLIELKALNPLITGIIQDVRCDDGLISEFSCSGACTIPLPPPDFCIVDPTSTPSTIGYLNKIFQTISSALQLCLSEPTQHIFVTPSTYFETNLVFLPPNPLTQDELIIEPYSTTPGDRVIIIGSNHVFPIVVTNFENVNITNIEFHTQNFTNTSTVQLADSLSRNIISGIVTNLILHGVRFQSLPDPDGSPFIVNNKPDVGTILSLVVLGQVVAFVDVEFLGATHQGVSITDFQGSDPFNGAFILWDQIVGKNLWGSFFQLIDVHKSRLINVSCTTWCSGMTLVDSITKIVNKPSVDITNKLYFEIEDCTIGLTNPVVQTSLGADASSTGYITGLWIENPDISALLVDQFWLRGVDVQGFPVALRYLTVSDEILYLNEPLGITPLGYDIKRGMRETARYNILEGYIYDVKNGQPLFDTLLGNMNACNDLCPTSETGICEVHADFNNPTVDGYGTRRFPTIQWAMRDCEIITEPVPIQVSSPNGPYTMIEHVEDVLFNETKDIHLFGELGMSTRPAIVGRHTILNGLSQHLIISDLEFLLDDRVVDRSLPIFQVSSPLSMDMTWENIFFHIGTATVPIEAPIITPVTSNSAFFHIHNVDILGEGFHSPNTSLFEIVFTNPLAEVRISELDVTQSIGPAIHIYQVDRITLVDSIFSSCSIGPLSDTYHACVRISLTDANAHIVIDDVTITRNGASTLSKRNGTYFTGLWVDVDLSVTSLNTTSILSNITNLVMSSNVPVGLRIKGIVFSPSILALTPLVQKKFVRTISLQNRNIVSTFHDVVLNVQDGNIETDPSSYEGYFCTDGCPISTNQNDVYFVTLPIIAVSVALFLLFLCAVGGGGGIYFLKKNPLNWNWGELERKRRKIKFITEVDDDEEKKTL